MINWVIYYGDKTRWSNEDGAWQAAPYLNVQAVAYNDVAGTVNDVGRRIEWMRDYYIWWPGAIAPWSTDLAGVYDYLIYTNSPLAGKTLAEMTLAELAAEGIKFGRNISMTQWRDVYRWVLDDPDLREKSAWSPAEVQPQ